MEKKDLIKKIALIGPESSGKSTLAAALAAYFQTEWVPEFARGYLLSTGGKYDVSDLLMFAQKQLQLENESKELKTTGRFLFCDTDLSNIRHWSEYEFGAADPWIISAEEKQDYDFYLLCYPDLPWVKDELRNNAHLLLELFEIYQRRLVEKNRPYAIVRGSGEQRLTNAIQEVHDFFVAK